MYKQQSIKSQKRPRNVLVGGGGGGGGGAGEWFSISINGSSL